VSYRGREKNGVIVLDENQQLDEGSLVEVTPLEPKTLADRLRGVIGAAKDLPPDLAENHDHYIHGAPKRTGQS
jgi:hypothetical protein